MRAELSRPDPLAKSRTLSKSDYKLARSCDAKLYFRENGYPDTRDYDPYLAFLAEGGYMVEALAKAKYAAGVQLEYGRNVAEDHERTRRELERDDVTLFEATLLAGRRLARVDVLEKRGNVARLVEVKSKSINGAEHSAQLRDGEKGLFRARKKPFGVLAPWRNTLEDITYQALLLEKVLPGVEVKPFVTLVDKSKRALVSGIPSLFELIFRDGPNGARRLVTARYTGDPALIAQLDLITEIDVSEEVELLRDEVEAEAERFERLLDAPLAAFAARVERSSKCGSCEFRVAAGERSGFAECWGSLASGDPHFLELHAVGNAKGPGAESLVHWMWNEKKSALIDVPTEGLVKVDGTVGVQAARQRRQIEHTTTGQPFIGSSLRHNIEAIAWPAYFIDFETSRLALPSHVGMRPYGSVTFQWSCHAVSAPGATPIHSEWLNTVDLWPNQTFAESLRAAIGDSGVVVTWSPFENITLKQIVADLAEFGRHEPELVDWMRSVEGRIVDLHAWARDEYFHPGMGGSTSIKVVMDALWKSDPVMREQFERWTGLTADGATDPYQSLPRIIIDGVERGVRDGTGAMRGYDAMMYGPNRGDGAVVELWARLLRQYCKLDTLSMVLILESWRRQVGLA